MSKRKHPKILDREALEKKGTKELLGYLKRLHKCEESFEFSDMETNPELTNTDTIYFKQSEKWHAAYKNVKAILETRENIKK